MEKQTRAVVIGRFMPPHNGHRYLIDFASALADRVTVFLCTLSNEPIPGELRRQWMEELFPRVDLIHITEEIPEANRNNPDSPGIWARALLPHLPGGTDFLVASEDYGWDLAKALGARFVPVDPGRNHVGVSASLIRELPLQYWDHIPLPVRPYFVNLIAVDAGDQSQSLSNDLAKEMNTLSVGNYGENYKKITINTPGNLLLSSSELQKAREAQFNTLLRLCNRYLFVPQNLVGSVVPPDRVNTVILGNRDTQPQQNPPEYQQQKILTINLDEPNRQKAIHDCIDPLIH